MTLASTHVRLGSGGATISPDAILRASGSRTRASPNSYAATARLASSPAFARVLSRARDGWARAARAAAGRAALRAWGVDDDEVEEVSERVLELRRGYADEDDPEDDDDDELEQM